MCANLVWAGYVVTVVSLSRLIRAAGLRWPVEESLQFSKGLLRARPVPGPPLHRDHPAHRAGHGRPSHLRHYRRPAAPPYRHPGSRASPAGPAPARRRRALADLAAPPPSPLNLAPPAHPARSAHRDHPEVAVLAEAGGCLQHRDILWLCLLRRCPGGLSAVRRCVRWRRPGGCRWLATGHHRELNGQGVVTGAMPSVQA